MFTDEQEVSTQARLVENNLDVLTTVDFSKEYIEVASQRGALRVRVLILNNIGSRSPSSSLRRRYSLYQTIIVSALSSPFQTKCGQSMARICWVILVHNFLHRYFHCQSHCLQAYTRLRWRSCGARL